MFDLGGGGGAKMMSGLLAAANDGSFSINETGGQALLQAIREMARWVDENIGQLRHLAQQQPLGTSNGAEVIKPYLQDVATDQEGFLTMLREFRTSLNDAEAGVIGAMNNYRNIDHDVAGTYQA
jgi:hypothetical protein